VFAPPCLGCEARARGWSRRKGRPSSIGLLSAFDRPFVGKADRLLKPSAHTRCLLALFIGCLWGVGAIGGAGN
jgi:hypothetical protein